MNLGIIGTGSRTDDYIRSYNSGLISNLKIKAMSDVNETRLKAFAGKYFNENSMPALYTDYNFMLADEEIDAVLICTPDTTHREIAIASLKREKNILLEKPLATTLEDCLEIYRESLRHQKVFQLAFGMRHSQLYKKVKEIVSSGHIGRIISVEANEALGFIHAASFFRRWQRYKANNGGFMNYKCCHDMDILNWIIDSEPAYVSAFGSRNYFNRKEYAAAVCRDCQLQNKCRYVYRSGDYNELFGQFNSLEDICVFNCDKDIIDHEVVNILYKNDVTVSFTVSLLSAEGNKQMTIFGSDATLYVDLLKQTITIKHIQPSNEILYRFDKHSQMEDGDTLLLRTFIDAISNNTGSSDAKAGLLSSGIALLAEMSMEQHKVYDLSTVLNLDRPWI